MAFLFISSQQFDFQCKAQSDIFREASLLAASWYSFCDNEQNSVWMFEA